MHYPLALRCSHLAHYQVCTAKCTGLAMLKVDLLLACGYFLCHGCSLVTDKHSISHARVNPRRNRDVFSSCSQSAGGRSIFGCMKLLFDENLSFRLVAAFTDIDIAPETLYEYSVPLASCNVKFDFQDEIAMIGITYH